MINQINYVDFLICDYIPLVTGLCHFIETNIVRIVRKTSYSGDDNVHHKFYHRNVFMFYLLYIFLICGNASDFYDYF